MPDHSDVKYTTKFEADETLTCVGSGASPKVSTSAQDSVSVLVNVAGRQAVARRRLPETKARKRHYGQESNGGTQYGSGHQFRHSHIPTPSGRT
jgi:hypothetical protein